MRDQVIYRKDPVIVKPSVLEDVPGMWEILDEYPEGAFFLPDGGESMVDLPRFREWFGHVAIYPVTAHDTEMGQVVGAGYLDYVQEGHYATVNVFKRKGYGKMPFVRCIMRGAMRYWFDLLGLEKIVGITRETNRACQILMSVIGFRMDGVLRHHKRDGDGNWHDYAFGTVLREDLAAWENCGSGEQL